MWVVVALVEAQVFGASWTARAANDHGVEHVADHGSVRHVRSADHHGDRDAASIGQDVPLYAAFRAVRRVRAREVPPFGAFTEALSRELHFHRNATRPVVIAQQLTVNRGKHAELDPLLKTQMARRA